MTASILRLIWAIVGQVGRFVGKHVAVTRAPMESRPARSVGTELRRQRRRFGSPQDGVATNLARVTVATQTIAPHWLTFLSHLPVEHWYCAEGTVYSSSPVRIVAHRARQQVPRFCHSYGLPVPRRLMFPGGGNRNLESRVALGREAMRGFLELSVTKRAVQWQRQISCGTARRRTVWTQGCDYA